ncbi:MAG: hypothetical protein AAGA58_13600 [Verrucomicrobiota bacterium]
MKSLLLIFLAVTLETTVAQETRSLDFDEVTIKDGVRFRIFTPKEKREQYKLLVFLPGGTGSDDFTPWCHAIYKQAIPEDFIGVQMISPPWANQNNVWPSSYSEDRGIKVSIEKVFEEVVKETAKRLKLEDDAIYTFSWSSGGPAAYLIAASNRDVKGHFVAMSVFREIWLPKQLRNVKDQRFFIYHSPDDTICDFRLTDVAKKTLEEEKADVRIQTYDGGHGWTQGHGHFTDIRKGFEWLTAKE